MPTLSSIQEDARNHHQHWRYWSVLGAGGETNPICRLYPYSRLRTRYGWNRIAFVRFSQVRGLPLVDVRVVCKTVGSAYVGSNPTPATTCENTP